MEAAAAKTISDGHHPHLLHHRSKPRLFTCERCKCRGYGRRYVCKDCKVAMHELCATCPDSLDFFMHPDHTLTLQRSHNPFARHTCEACGDPVHGYFFRCKPCSFELHPFCSLLRPAIADDSHPGHTLRYEKGGSAPCVVCGESCSGWRYACRECPADVHMKCLSVSRGAAAAGSGEVEEDTKRRRKKNMKTGLKVAGGVGVALALVLAAVAGAETEGFEFNLGEDGGGGDEGDDFGDDADEEDRDDEEEGSDSSEEEEEEEEEGEGEEEKGEEEEEKSKEEKKKSKNPFKKLLGKDKKDEGKDKKKKGKGK